MHYIHYITCIIYDISSTLYDVTFTMCVTSHNDSIYDIKHYMFMTYSLDMASRTVLWPDNHCVSSQPLCLTLYSVYFIHYTQCTNFMKSECMSSQHLYVWYHMHYIWHHIHSFTSHHFIYDVEETISNLKPVKTAISSTLYVITPSLLKTAHLLCKTS